MAACVLLWRSSVRKLSLRAVALLLLAGLSACSSNKPADGAVAVYLQVDAGVKRLFTRLRDNGLKTDQNYLFVVDGAKGVERGYS